VSRSGLWIMFIAALFAGCKGDQENTVSDLESTIDWQRLENSKVVFGHQSVGGNILDGVRKIADRNGANLSIVEQRGAASGTGISHFMIGRNEDPLLKISDFAEALDTGAAQGADVALMKLCYVDFSVDTNVNEIAQAYIQNLDSLAAKYPDTVFVATTAPLRAVQRGPKAWIKKLLGRTPAQYQENLVRGEYNQIIRERYSNGGLLFDLARVEAEATGQRTTVTVDGHEVEVLAPELTSDGGHLNEKGQTLVAAEFLAFVDRSALPNR